MVALIQLTDRTLPACGPSQLIALRCQVERKGCLELRSTRTNTHYFSCGFFSFNLERFVISPGFSNAHNFRSCEKSSPPRWGGIFVERDSRGSAPQRGAISLLSNRPICFKAAASY